MLASVKQQLVDRCSEYLKTDIAETFNLHENDVLNTAAESGRASEWPFIRLMQRAEMVNYIFCLHSNGNYVRIGETKLQELRDEVVKNVSEFLLKKESEYANKYSAEKLVETQLARFASNALHVDRAICMTSESGFASPHNTSKLIKLRNPVTATAYLRPRAMNVQYISTWQLFETTADGMKTVWKLYPRKKDSSTSLFLSKDDECFAVKRISRDGPLHNTNQPRWRFTRKRKSDHKWLPLTLSDMRFRSLHRILRARPMNKSYPKFVQCGESLPMIEALVNGVFIDASRLILRHYVLMYLHRKS